MTKNEAEILQISRHLTPEYRAELLDRVRHAWKEQPAGGPPFLPPAGQEDAGSRARDYCRAEPALGEKDQEFRARADRRSSVQGKRL